MGANPETDEDNAVSAVSAGELRQFVERLERIEEEKKAASDAFKEVMGEAKSRGYDTKILKRLLVLRKKDPDERSEEETLLDLYMSALGMT